MPRRKNANRYKQLARARLKRHYSDKDVEEILANPSILSVKNYVIILGLKYIFSEKMKRNESKEEGKRKLSNCNFVLKLNLQM